ncbi:MAG TPA: hypothetical protein VFX16_16580 [Pseudonocardiaceae bacterium]|nr:hypothetical protein [Pseudonocardiaceae bacterium]
MRVRELLAALAEQWSQLREQLAPGQFTRLTELVAALSGEAIPSRLVRRADQIAEYLVETLPDGHPLLLILEQPVLRLANVSTDSAELAAWQSVVGALRFRLPGAEPAPTVDEVARRTSGWLLAESIGEAEVRELGHDPDEPELIRLTRSNGDPAWPVFQFVHSGPIRRINQILGAADDPWGAADWWLGANGWLDKPPAQLLGLIDDETLIRAALIERADGDDV